MTALFWLAVFALAGRSLPACLDIPPGTPTGFVISIIITIITK